MNNRASVDSIKFLFLLWACLAITACGGGSGSDSNNPPEQDSGRSGQVPITSDNAVEVVDTVMSKDALESTDIATQRGLNMLAGSGGQAGVRQLVSAALAPSLGKLQKVLVNSAQTDIDIREDCLFSGFVHVSGIISETGIAVGDQLSVDFGNCMDGDVQIDGSITITFTEVSDNFMESEESGFSVSIAFAALSVVAEEEFASIDGGANLSHTASGEATLLSVNGTSLAVTSSVGSLEMRNFEISEYTDLADQLFSFSLSGTVESEDLAGSVTVDTQAAFVQRFTDTYPYQGILLIEGASGSSVLFTVLDNANVRFEVDANGDGTVDEIITTTWQEALPDFY